MEDIGSVFTSGARHQYTHFQHSSHARLDRLYVSLELVPLCATYEVKPVSFSDHCLVISAFGKKENKEHFNGDLRKLNAKLLKDEGFVKCVEEQLTQSINVGVEWEEFIQVVEMKAVERSSALRHEEKRSETQLREQLEFLTGVECV